MEENVSAVLTPPKRSKWLLSDIRAFFLHKPDIPTLIRFDNEEERQNYSHRIMQRLNINVDKYNVLNIHKIGVAAPPIYIYEELLQWDGTSTCWPNHIAAVDLVNGDLEHMRIFMLGLKRFPPLFKMDALRLQHLPNPTEVDNARYLLYECHGGYPIGIFSIYVRSSITDQNEKEQSQLFMMVGFNFYGREDISQTHIINRLWEKIHNRVTANIMNRLKQLCEWRFDKLRKNCPADCKVDGVTRGT
ncbi:MAG: hypothetical protein GY765_21630 [bacterium]|nr:hypothetical protein [bacterium]